jgi:hypothetical protein
MTARHAGAAQFIANCLRRAGPLGGGLLGTAYFFWVFGPRTVLPSNIGWLMSGDRASQFLGWLYFLNADWSFPLGRIDDCLAPIGSYLAFCDPVPWLAVLFKLLAPLWDGPFQYSGLWLLGCWFFQGWFGALLARRISASLHVQLTAAALFVLSPLLLARGDHIALNGQFLLLAALHLYLLDGDRSGGGPHTVRWTLLCGFVTGVNPYLAMMVLPIAVASHIRFGLSRAGAHRVRASTLALLPLAAVLLVLFLFGFFSAGPVGEAGFGFYSANLDTLINPRLGKSRLFGGWPIMRGQYEGSAYLGAGVWFLFMVGALGWILRPRAIPRERVRGLLPLLLALGVMALYALATPVCWHRTQLLDLDLLYRHLDFLTGAFRVSGRFVWPLAYAATLGALALAVRRLGPRWRAVILVLTVALQAAELAPRRPGRRGRSLEWNRLRDGFWERLDRDHDRLVLVPPQVLGRWTGPSDYPHDHYVPFAFLAATRGMACNSGFVARVSQEAVTTYWNSLKAELRAGVIDPRAVYIVDKGFLAKFCSWTGDRLEYRQVDGFHLFTAPLPADRALWLGGGGSIRGEQEACGILPHHRPGIRLVEVRAVQQVEDLRDLLGVAEPGPVGAKEDAGRAVPPEHEDERLAGEGVGGVGGIEE